MSVPYEFAPSTVAKSSEVNANFEVLSHSGMIVAWPSDTIPTGWLLCDGSAVSRTTYADLFARIGTTFGAGDGSTTFNVPNIKGKVIVGKDASQNEFDTMGETGGAKTHTLTTTEIPAHYHSVDPPSTQSGDDSPDHTHSSYYLSAWGNAGSGSSQTNIWKQGPTWASTTGASARHRHYVDIAAFNSGNAGGGGAHNNLQPYIVLNYLIKT